MTPPASIGCLLVAGWSAYGAATADVALTVHPDRVVSDVDEKVYGHFLEHIYHSVNGGLWGELIWDRSFEGGGAGVAWEVRGDSICQEGGSADVRLTFGSPEWTDCEFTLDARKTDGAEGFLILLRALNGQEFYWANLGGWGNVGHALERGIKGGGRWGPVTPRHDGRIETNRWYSIRARCEGLRIQVWLDGDPVVDYTDDGQGPQCGPVGVGTWLTQAEFRNLRVTSLDGATLYEGLPPVPEDDARSAPRWRTIGSATASISLDEPLNGERCKFVETKPPFGGIAQGPVNVLGGEVYRGSLYLRGRAPDGLRVRLVDGEDMLAEQALPAPSAEWQEMPIELAPTGSSEDAALEIVVPGEGEVWLDQVSLMPDSWRKRGGFRPDLLQAVAGLRPPVIRWPGGCFASPYRWKGGIGRQHKRVPQAGMMWDDREVNAFGTDEFVAMCRRVGAEPLIVVNTGTPNWNRDAGDNDFVQEVCDWIEYCNGPADSEWGKVRAANGHPEPYGVKYWEIDNETWHMGAETYAEWVNRFAPAMRKADPSIKLAACGSAGHGDDGNGLAWNRVLIERCADKIDYLSIHHYSGPDAYADDPRAYEAFFRKTGALIEASTNPNLRVYVSEWNAQSTDWRTGLYCGGLLNAFERCGDIVEMGGPALFLRHVSASDWDNAFVNFDHRTWFPAPNYVVMKLWREHCGPHRIALDGEPGGLNVSATKSADGGSVYIKAVNPTDEAVPVVLTLDGGVARKASLQVVAPGALDARNTLDERNNVRPETAPVEQDGRTLTFTLPAISCGVLSVRID